ELHRRPRRRQPRYGGAGHGLRGGVRRRDSRRCRRDHPDRRRCGPLPGEELLLLTHDVIVMMRRVVVTGIGMVTPLGSGVETTWSRLIAGESGAVRVTHFDVSDLPSQIACR